MRSKVPIAIGKFSLSYSSLYSENPVLELSIRKPTVRHRTQVYRLNIYYWNHQIETQQFIIDRV